MYINATEFNQLMASFAPFEANPTVVVATSGGPDSLALALLTHEWAKEQGGNAIAITVDHQLREDSTSEALQVKAWLEARGVEHHILSWEREKESIQSALQAEAREARYRLLGQWCRDHGVKHLLTAHHAQDQLETFLIRLAKGSGLKGLTSTQGSVNTHFWRILRPLLTIEPNRLKETLEHFQQPYLKDPSNENEDFTRVRWRQLLPLLAAEGLTPLTLQESLERLSHSQRVVEQYVAKLIQKYVVFSPYGYAILRKEVLNESPEALEEILKSLLSTIGNQCYPVRRLALHRAMDSLQLEKSITLGGCQLINKAEEWWIVREPVALKHSIFVEAPGQYLWDNRFTVEVDRPCNIRALAEQGIQLLDKEVKKQFEDIPHVVLQTLPALWQNEELIDPAPVFRFTPT